MKTNQPRQPKGDNKSNQKTDKSSVALKELNSLKLVCKRVATEQEMAKQRVEQTKNTAQSLQEHSKSFDSDSKFEHIFAQIGKVLDQTATSQTAWEHALTGTKDHQGVAKALGEALSTANSLHKAKLSSEEACNTARWQTACALIEFLEKYRDHAKSIIETIDAGLPKLKESKLEGETAVSDFNKKMEAALSGNKKKPREKKPTANEHKQPAVPEPAVEPPPQVVAEPEAPAAVPAPEAAGPDDRIAVPGQDNVEPPRHVFGVDLAEFMARQKKEYPLLLVPKFIYESTKQIEKAAPDVCDIPVIYDADEHVSEFQDIIEKIPADSQVLLAFICAMLLRVAAFSSKNLMPVNNLATMMAPNMLYRKPDKVSNLLADSGKAQVVFVTLINKSKEIFAKFPQQEIMEKDTLLLMRVPATSLSLPSNTHLTVNENHSPRVSKRGNDGGSDLSRNPASPRTEHKEHKDKAGSPRDIAALTGSGGVESPGRVKAKRVVKSSVGGGSAEEPAPTHTAETKERKQPRRANTVNSKNRPKVPDVEVSKPKDGADVKDGKPSDKKSDKKTKKPSSNATPDKPVREGSRSKTVRPAAEGGDDSSQKAALEAAAKQAAIEAKQAEAAAKQAEQVAKQAAKQATAAKLAAAAEDATAKLAAAEERIANAKLAEEKVAQKQQGISEQEQKLEELQKAQNQKLEELQKVQQATEQERAEVQRTAQQKAQELERRAQELQAREAAIEAREASIRAQEQEVAKEKEKIETIKADLSKSPAAPVVVAAPVAPVLVVETKPEPTPVPEVDKVPSLPELPVAPEVPVQWVITTEATAPSQELAPEQAEESEAIVASLMGTKPKKSKRKKSPEPVKSKKSVASSSSSSSEEDNSGYSFRSRLHLFLKMEQKTKEEIEAEEKQHPATAAIPQKATTTKKPSSVALNNNKPKEQTTQTAPAVAPAQQTNPIPPLAHNTSLKVPLVAPLEVHEEISAATPRGRASATQPLLPTENTEFKPLSWSEFESIYKVTFETFLNLGTSEEKLSESLALIYKHIYLFDDHYKSARITTDKIYDCVCEHARNLKTKFNFKDNPLMASRVPTETTKQQAVDAFQEFYEQIKHYVGQTSN